MLRVTHANWTEALLAALAERLPRDPFVQSTLVVPNRAMERVVELGLARASGLVANVRFARLEEWLEDALQPPPQPAPSGAPAAEAPRLLSAKAWLGRVLAVLSDEQLVDEGRADEGRADEGRADGELEAALDPALAPLVRYLLAGDGRWHSAVTDRRRLELASRLAQLFQEYAYSRPDWVRSWMNEPSVTKSRDARTEAWQAALYRRARALGAPSVTLAERLDALATRPDTAPLADGPVFVFGVSYVARIFHEAIARVARHRDVELFVLNPCRELWSDVASRTHGRRRAQEELTPDALESRLLETWGRPGREHVAALDEAVGFDTTTRFVTPHGESTLARVQRSILERTAVEPGAADGSLVVLACPSVRREVETVVSIAWGLVAEADRLAHEGPGEPLRLNEIAILVPARERERYMPHLEVVMEGAREGDDGEAHGLPWSAQDLKLAARSRVAEAGLRLWSFFGASPTRREVLGVVAHPLVRATSELEAPSERAWAELADEVGIVRGIDERDLRGTYADLASGEGHVLHFDQGLTRLALGCALGDGDDGDDDAPGEAATAGREPTGGAPARLGTETAEALAFVTLVRSLLADHRAIAAAQLTWTAWAELFDRLLEAYVRVTGTAEEAELERCRAAMRGLAALDVGPVGTPSAPRRYGAELALGFATRALEEVPAVRGEPQTMGVVVASLLPMRAIPFRAVFVLGLGEGVFPEEHVELGLDLRRAERRAGDVAPEERDRYAFLETLVSTRERLFLSYVARDEHTGDPHAPSSVLTELQEAVGAEGLLTCEPPARRHEALRPAGDDRTRDWLAGVGLDSAQARAAMASALGGAVAERAARARGDIERVHLRDIELPSEAWGRLPGDDVRRVELALPALPPVTLASERVVRADVLRGFLLCPVQGRARHWLRDVESDEALLLDEEPLDVEGNVLARLARAAFTRALDAGLGESPTATLGHAVREVVAQARGRGHVPVGVLGEQLVHAVNALAAQWLGALLEARPGARCARAVRFGRVSSDRAAGREHLEVRPAIVLGPTPVPPRASPAHREAAAAATATVEGRTRACLRSEPGAPAGDLVAVLSGAAMGEGERARLVRGAAMLEAYVDHALLAASGQARLSRRVLLLARDGAYETTLPGLTSELASRWLRGLSDEVRATEDPCWFLPAEAVLLEAEALRRGDPKLTEKLAKAIERVRTKHEGGSSRVGPLRAAEVVQRDAPEPHELLALVARRHAPALSKVSAPTRTSSRDDAQGLLR